MKTIDLVGHFGTTFSYATVGSRVARALLGAGKLRSVTNLDPAWHDAFADLKALDASRVPDVPTRGTHVLLFTAPNHYIDIYATQYGRERSALFMSPNTNALAQEHARTAYKFGTLLCPSSWCEQVARECTDAVATYEEWDTRMGPDPNAKLLPRPEVVVLPLGADELLDEGRYERLGRISGLKPEDPLVALHFSSDQFWPGRKGTEPLIVAWSMLSKSEREHLILRLHVPPSLARDATHMARDYGIDESVDLVVLPQRGSSRQALAKQFDEADLLIAPSRCEGFGIMFMSALVAGVPLLCTAQTGPYDYLQHFDGWAGIPTAEWGDLAREAGQAPVVHPQVLVNSLRTVLSAGSLARMASVMAGKENYRGWLWPEVAPLWVERLTEWMEETDGSVAA